MKRSQIDDVEKKEIGARIKRLRKEAGLRQWQLAELIGATQPAIHMYERGVLPEPKRLLEIARIGNTTVEWILTGTHWENGSPEMQRVPREIYELAFKFREYSEEDREALGAALEVINKAVESIQKTEKEEIEKLGADEVAQRLKDFSRETRKALSTALEIHYAVYRALLEKGVDRMKASRVHGEGKETAEEGAGRARRAVYARSSSIEPIQGHIFRLDPSMLVLREILANKELRKEFEENLSRLANKLDTRQRKVQKFRKRATR